MSGMSMGMHVHDKTRRYRSRMGKQKREAEWGSRRDKQNGEAAGTSRMGKQRREAEWGSWSEKQKGEAGVRSRMGKLE